MEKKVLVDISARSGSSEVSWVVAMAILLHQYRYWETSFLIQIYLNYSLCRIYFSFQVRTCLSFGIRISETEYPQVICSDFVRSTWI